MNPYNLDFSGKNVLVTGASRGIGRATAQMFARHCARVIVHFHSNRKAAEETLKLLGSDQHLLFSADLRDPNETARLVESSVAAVGTIDILVNNAGVFEEHRVMEVDYESWQASWKRTIDANLIGPANLIHQVVPHMRKQGGGRIVNVSSRGAFRGEPNAPAYGASKAGLNAMGQSLAKALGREGIYVFTVAPGWVDTDMAASELESPSGDEVRQQSPLGRVAKPEEIAWTILLLAAPGSEFMTGCIVDANGASYLRS
jgi:NAD(P)-dependent dehydrogenase (short-subunit alcohol dehydrogenase family)